MEGTQYFSVIHSDMWTKNMVHSTLSVHLHHTNICSLRYRVVLSSRVVLSKNRDPLNTTLLHSVIASLSVQIPFLNVSYNRKNMTLTANRIWFMSKSMSDNRSKSHLIVFWLSYYRSHVSISLYLTYASLSSYKAVRRPLCK